MSEIIAFCFECLRIVNILENNYEALLKKYI